MTTVRGHEGKLCRSKGSFEIHRVRIKRGGHSNSTFRLCSPSSEQIDVAPTRSGKRDPMAAQELAKTPKPRASDEVVQDTSGAGGMAGSRVEGNSKKWVLVMVDAMLDGVGWP